MDTSFIDSGEYDWSELLMHLMKEYRESQVSGLG